eukprot:gnl/MRDRNA2_/MRDRNA2_124067_c0_seq1.p1 gnl/MRDRNA2_/MRDRNA2_124067_c0~~gnl/MRDRNA2_/MRDRNA2_124067_c0_seq1.p1  ORF type:complete len:631 (+),score=123.87 gnl/MRDRNA2_/MRDRNA2_124067_c0_seq1:83-1975(+)
MTQVLPQPQPSPAWGDGASSSWSPGGAAASGRVSPTPGFVTQSARNASRAHTNGQRFTVHQRVSDHKSPVNKRKTQAEIWDSALNGQRGSLGGNATSSVGKTFSKKSQHAVCRHESIPDKFTDTTQENRINFDGIMALIAGPTTESSPFWMAMDLLRARARQVLDSMEFDLVIAVIVLLNLAVVAADAEYRIGREAEPPSDLAAIDFSCLVVYTIELLARWVAWGKRMRLNLWNAVDTVIVIIGIACEILNTIDGRVEVLVRVLKCFRAIRILRAVRSFSFLRPLRMITHDIGGTLRLISAGFLLILLETLIFGIFGMELLHDKITEKASEGHFDAPGSEHAALAFSSLFRSFSSLFGILTLGQWHDIAFPIAVALPWSLPYFLLFVFCTTFGVVRMLSASMVLAPKEWVKHQEEFAINDRIAAREDAYRKLEEIFKDLDADCSGQISFEEFKMVQQTSKEFVQVMKGLDIEEEDLENVWHLLDADGNGHISEGEFMDTMWRLQSSETKWTLMRTCKAVTATDLKIERLSERTELGFRELSDALMAQKTGLLALSARLAAAPPTSSMASSSIGDYKSAAQRQSASPSTAKGVETIGEPQIMMLPSAMDSPQKPEAEVPEDFSPTNREVEI